MAKSSKGADWEREFCKMLTAWWTGDPEADVIFWRTSQSGGRATARRRAGKKAAAAHCGDVYAIDPIGEPLTKLITFELKRGYNSSTIHAVFDNPTGGAVQEYIKWIQQAREAAANAGTLYWAIIHWRNRRVPLIFIPWRLYAMLFPFPSGNECPMMKCSFWINEGWLSLAGMPLCSFLDGLKPKTVRDVYDTFRPRNQENG